MEEVWRDIPGYIGYYQVSNRGRVRSLERVVAQGQRILRGRIMSPCHSKEIQYMLSRDGVTSFVLLRPIQLMVFDEAEIDWSISRQELQRGWSSKKLDNRVDLDEH